MNTTIQHQHQHHHSSQPGSAAPIAIPTPAEASQVTAASRRIVPIARNPLWLVPIPLAVAVPVIVIAVGSSVHGQGANAPAVAVIIGFATAELASAALLFLIARRLWIPRLTAVVVVLAFFAALLSAQALSDQSLSAQELFNQGLSVHALSGQVLSAGIVPVIAQPWLLFAFFLALSRTRQLAGYAGAAVVFGIAVVIAPVEIIALPALVWVVSRGAQRATRRYTIAVAASAFLLVAAAGVIALAVSGASIEQGFLGVLVSSSSGLDPGRDPAGQIWAGVVVAIATSCLSLAVAATAFRCMRPIRVVFLLAAAIVVILPIAGSPLGAVTLTRATGSVLGAETWVQANTPITAHLIADDSTTADLNRAGVAAGRLTAAPSTDSRTSPSDFRDGDYLLATPALRAAAPSHPTLEAAFDGSTVVARFGSGAHTVEVRRIESAVGALEEQKSADQAAKAAGRDLAENPRLRASKADIALLASGHIDARVSFALGQLLAVETVTVSGFPTIAGDTGTLARQMVITEIGGASTRETSQAARDIAVSLESSPEEFRPLHVDPTPKGLVVTYPSEPFISS